MFDIFAEINRITRQHCEIMGYPAPPVLKPVAPVPQVDRSIYNLLKHCRPHLADCAIDGRGDSRAVLRWLDEAIAAAEQAQGIAIPEGLRK